MLILRPYEPKVLLPVPQWREPSAAQPKDQFGNPVVQTRFRVRARLHDGHVRWTGWFDSRDDFDAFLWAIIEHQELGTSIPPTVWRLPTPHWHPDLGEDTSYDFATVTFYTAVGSSTWTRPVDYQSSGSKFEAIGGGGSGGAGVFNLDIHLTGGGGGEYRFVTNYAASATENYTIGAGGASVVTTGPAGSFPGADTTFASNLVAKAGGAGNGGGGSVNGGSGGTGGTGAGGGNNGGNGGNLTGASGRGASGGGGAGGANGAGVAGFSSSATTNPIATNGGAGDGGAGGAGSAGVTAGNSGNGGNGTEWDPSHGSGGASGGCSHTGSTTSGTAGLYGAGSGAAMSTNGTGTATSAAGGQGILVVTYTPVTSGIVNASLVMGTGM